MAKRKTTVACECLSPPVELLCKLGSIAVHADELSSPGGHEFDHHALRALLNDPQVSGWLTAMGNIALVPVKRTHPPTPKESKRE